MTSHAAVVARGMGRACVSGAGDLRFDETATARSYMRDLELSEGDIITIDGGTGEVFLGQVGDDPAGNVRSAFATVMGNGPMKPAACRCGPMPRPRADARTAVDFGAEGIGLCRTEHMFFDVDRIVAMREMIMAVDTEGREVALAKLLPMQRQDFDELFTIMAGLPVTIRLLDPPLHEFLPHSPEELADVAAGGRHFSGNRAATLDETVGKSNPMLGHRGCRLAVTYPEICRMQARAIFEAASAVDRARGRCRAGAGNHDPAGGDWPRNLSCARR